MPSTTNWAKKCAHPFTGFEKSEAFLFVTGYPWRGKKKKKKTSVRTNASYVAIFGSVWPSFVL